MLFAHRFSKCFAADHVTPRLTGKDDIAEQLARRPLRVAECLGLGALILGGGHDERVEDGHLGAVQLGQGD